MVKNFLAMVQLQGYGEMLFILIAGTCLVGGVVVATFLLTKNMKTNHDH